MHKLTVVKRHVIKCLIKATGKGHIARNTNEYTAIGKDPAVDEVGLKKSDLDTPVLWVDLDKLEDNIISLGSFFHAAGVQWRPHTKGVKIPAIAHKAIRAGAIGVTCAKLGEAEVMVASGITDILVANQVVGPQKVTRLVNLCRQADVKIAVDSDATLAVMSQAAIQKGVEIGILVELNTGMNRAGVEPGGPAVELSRKVHATPGLAYRGLMAWEGHACVTDETDWKEDEIKRSVGLLADTAEACRAEGLPVDIVSGGGSGTYKVTSQLEGITEIQAGGAVFNDVSYSSWGVETNPSLYVRVTVTSRPSPTRMITDAGWKTLPGWIGEPVPVGLSGVESISMSAEHGTVTFSEPNTDVRIGDVFDFMVSYTDQTLFLHDTLYGIRDGIVEVVWTITARGKLR
ncbi:MAG: DSD1 family PLP-dependent enzyme [Candidatus Latescibacteria bacterium]|nr:DSD1 family PLP-dependent enzyme [Candidatus Latescibacterota bacterium]